MRLKQGRLDDQFVVIPAAHRMALVGQFTVFRVSTPIRVDGSHRVVEFAGDGDAVPQNLDLVEVGHGQKRRRRVRDAVPGRAFGCDIVGCLQFGPLAFSVRTVSRNPQMWAFVESGVAHTPAMPSAVKPPPRSLVLPANEDRADQIEPSSFVRERNRAWVRRISCTGLMRATTGSPGCSVSGVQPLRARMGVASVSISHSTRSPDSFGAST